MDTQRKPPKANQLRRPPLEVIERAKAAGVRSCIVAFSGGKDSIATIDLAAKHFDRIEAYHMHFIKGLSWEEEPIRWAEKHYGIQIARIPNWVLCRLFRCMSFRHPTEQASKAAILRPADIYAYVRKRFGIDWIAAGERASDSLERQAYIKNCNGVQEQWRRFFPVGFWREQDVMSYLMRHNLPTPSQYNFAEASEFKVRGGKRREFGGFQMDTIAFIRQNKPEDYAKIRRMFPLIESQYVRWRSLIDAGKLSPADAVSENDEADDPPERA